MPDKQDINVLLSSSKTLIVDNLKNKLTYTLDVTNGRIDYLEVVINGNESSDGSFKNFYFKET